MKLLTLIFTLISMSSCGNSKNVVKNNMLPNKILEGDFIINSINDNDVFKSELTLNFNDSEKMVSGYSGCNQFSGKYVIDGNTLKIGPLASTRKMCPEEINKIESSLLKALSETTSFDLSKNHLILKNDDKDIMTAVKKENDMSITYQAATRGFFEKIWINEHFINFSNDYNLTISEKVECPSKDWNELTDLIKKIDMSLLPNLEAPSKSSHHDAAAAATLEIGIQGKTYKTPIFDHGNPPKSIENIVNKVLSMKKMAEKQ